MASQPEKIRLHQERERVLALGRLFAPDPERAGTIAFEARFLPLPDGLACRIDAAKELTSLLGSEFADVRRLAASALGKMAPERPVPEFLTRLAELARTDDHPQVRQYAVKALGQYPKEAFLFLDDLKDVSRDETAPAYVRSAAVEAVAAIQGAHRARFARDHHFCARCKGLIDEAQFEHAMVRWGKPYCRHCLDEKDFESHDFESMVEASKNRRTKGGTAVQSRGERRIAEFLESEKIAFVYDERYRISGSDLIRPDFYLPEFDVYIEYYGMDTPEYNENRQRKHVLYQRAAKKLISVSFRDDVNLIEVLKAKLARYIRFEEGK